VEQFASETMTVSTFWPFTARWGKHMVVNNPIVEADGLHSFFISFFYCVFKILRSQDEKSRSRWKRQKQV